MKKVLIVGADIPMGAQISKITFEKEIKERGITIVTNNHEIKDVMRSEWLLKNNLEDYSYNTLENTKFFEKPKSKFHK